MSMVSIPPTTLPTPQPVHREGYLFKKAENGSWEPRYFTLKNGKVACSWLASSVSGESSMRLVTCKPVSVHFCEARGGVAQADVRFCFDIVIKGKSAVVQGTFKIKIHTYSPS
jgi:hypothetical protein